MFQYPIRLSFDTEAKSVYTIPLIREHCDSYLYYLRYKTLTTKRTPSQTPFQLIFNPVYGINTGIFYRTIPPQNFTISIQMFLLHIWTN